MGEGQVPRLRAIHRALGDPLRMRVFELIAVRPHSARELAERVGLRPERLYHHLAQLEAAGLIRIAEYRPLPGGKVERVYAPTATEPPGDDASPADLALVFNAALESARADVNAATLAKEAGEDRRVSLGRVGVRLNERHREELITAIEELVRAAADNPDADGVWTAVTWTAIDRQDRGPARSGPTPAHDPPDRESQERKQ